LDVGTIEPVLPLRSSRDEGLSFNARFSLKRTSTACRLMAMSVVTTHLALLNCRPDRIGVISPPTQLL
jgi:hypothetical protein